MNIIYRDNDIILIFKEAGLAVQSRNVMHKDAESLLLSELMQNGGTGKKPELHVINRLDQPVEGLVLFALNKKAAAALTKQLTDGNIEKIYRAQIAGTIPADEGTLTDYLQKDGRSNTSRIVSKGTPNAKKATLSYKKVSDDEIEIKLLTGRHHQIRVQLAHAGMPIRGDRKYGKSDPDYRGRLMLTACRLTFIHPSTGKKMDFCL